MTTTTKEAHTPGALKAAEAIIDRMLEWNGWPRSVISRDDASKLAAIIDRETAAPEMLEALERLREAFAKQAQLHRDFILGQSPETYGDVSVSELIEAAIQKARGGQ